jgi:hypothetical protein
VCELNRIHIHAPCVNWSAGFSYPHPRACPLIGSFCCGLLIVTAEKVKATEISYLDARLLVTFLRGFILWQQGTYFYVWLWYKRERTSKHSALWLILGGYAPSYKSDSLVFRCSFYYLICEYCFIIIILLVIIIYCRSYSKRYKSFHQTLVPHSIKRLWDVTENHSYFFAFIKWMSL